MANDQTMTKRSQQQRTSATVATLLESAMRLFGERGYAATALEDIAADCGLTIGAIYHHFGNKKALFGAVNDAAEQRIIEAGNSICDDDPARLMRERWRAFLALCDDPGFRRIVLIDSPHILGRNRWADSEVTTRVDADMKSDDHRQRLALRILRGAMTEAALALAESDNAESARALIDAIIERILAATADQMDTKPSSLREEQ